MRMGVSPSVRSRKIGSKWKMWLESTYGTRQMRWVRGCVAMEGTSLMGVVRDNSVAGGAEEVMG